MKKLLSTMIALAFVSAAGVALAEEEDEALLIAPNAQQVITSTPATGPVVYDRDDDAVKVAPNATMEIEQTTYVWGSYPTD
jgi:hypothetical protein